MYYALSKEIRALPPALEKRPYRPSASALLYVGGLITSSFDKFLVLDAGVTIRISQIMLLLPMMVGVARFSLARRPYAQPGIALAILWACISFVAMVLHGYSTRAVGYNIWLVFDLVLVLSTSELFDTWGKAAYLIKWYLYSFAVTALFGIVQFAAAYSVGLDLLVSQWIVPNRVPRVNGFSYEPSYFSTYLLIGWIICAAYVQKQPKYWPVVRLRLIFILISVALILSTSRMGYIAMGLWVLRYFVDQIRRFDYRSKRLKKICLIILVTLAIIGSALPSLKRGSPGKLKFLFEGSGLAGTASHSVDTRKLRTNDTFRVFLKNPVIGVGMGGVAEEIAKADGLNYHDHEVLKISEGMCVGAEVLAGTGILGFLSLGCYLGSLIRKALRQAGRSGQQVALLLRALSYSLIAELLLLQFNQNILRPYVWLHIAILCTIIRLQAFSSDRRVGAVTQSPYNDYQSVILR